MFDIHSHILPDTDDGAKDLDEALAMARKAVAGGINAIFATPHYLEGVYQPTKATLLQRVASFNNFLANEGINLVVYPGCEAYLEPNLLTFLERQEILTLNNGGKYLLVEPPLNTLPNYLEALLTEIIKRGITPVLAHPERNVEIQKSPNILFELIKLGIHIQINGGSLLGSFGTNAQKAAKIFLEHKWVNFMASDAHSAKHRLPALQEAFDLACNLIGEEARMLVWDNPKVVIEGGKLNNNPQPLINKRSFWKIMRGWF